MIAYLHIWCGEDLSAIMMQTTCPDLLCTIANDLSRYLPSLWPFSILKGLAPFMTSVKLCVGSAKLGLRIPQKMGVGCNLQIPLTPDGTTSIKDYHRPFWPWVLLFPATVKTAEWHYRTEAIIHETQKHKPAATKWTHRRMRILNDICFGLWAVRANHNETVRHHVYC